MCDPTNQSIDKEILDLLPKIKEAKNIVGLMDRDSLTFDVALQRTEDEVRVYCFEEMKQEVMAYLLHQTERVAAYRGCSRRVYNVM